MPTSVLGRLGRWCFRRWWWVLAAWMVAITVGALSFGPVFGRLDISTNGMHGVESVQANDVLREGNRSAGTVVGILSGIDPAADGVADTVAATADRTRTLPGVIGVIHPYIPGLTPAQRAALISADGRSLMILVTLDDLDRIGQARVIDEVSPPLRALPESLPGASAQVGGTPVLNREADTAFRKDLTQAETLSLPLTLVLLIVIFGGLAAAGLPVLAAFVSVAVSMAVLLGFSTFTDIDQNAVTVTTLLGLGLSVDYGLLLVSRYREELALGFDRDAAVARAWATAGRTIMFSALTVAAALTGLLTFHITALSALGAAGVSVAIVAMLAALTFTAAVLGALKRFIRPSRRALRHSAHPATEVGEHGFFARLSLMVQRRPLMVTVATGALLLAVGAPLLTANLKLPQLEGIPRSIESARVADTMATEFHRPARAAIIVVARTSPSTLDGWAAQWRGDPNVLQVRPATSAGNGVASLSVDMVGDPQGPAARDVVAQMREHRPVGSESWVGGDAALVVDVLHLIGQGAPFALGVTILGMVLLLFLMTGSVVIPIKAIVANVLSLAATLGVMTAVFQDGVASAPLHTLTIGGLSPFVLVIVFGFAFGLSMDYEVFLLGRIKEYVDAGLDTDTAVRKGLQHTGRVITSAAALIVLVFACFASARTGTIEQIGIGLTTAIIVDATIVRCLLVPATMTLLGRWNWWAPAPLHRLHCRFGLKEANNPPPTRVVDPTPMA